MTKKEDEKAAKAEAKEEAARAEEAKSEEAPVVKKQDETIPGGDFIVDGRHVDADGKEIK